MDWSVSGILDRLDNIILGGIQVVFGAMSSALDDLFVSAAIIAFAWQVIITFSAIRTQSIKDFFYRSFFIILVTGIITHWDYVNLFIVDAFYHSPSAIVAYAIEALTGRAMASPNAVFEQLATMALKMGFMIRAQGDGILDMAINAIYAGAFTYVLAKLILKGLVPLITAKMIIMLMACVAFLIAIAYLFNRGRDIATGWLQVLISNALIVLFIYLIVTIFSVFVTAFYADFRAMTDYTEMIKTAFAFGFISVAMNHVLINAEIAARNLGNAYGMGSPNIGQRAAWQKFVGGAKGAMGIGRGKGNVKG